MDTGLGGVDVVVETVEKADRRSWAGMRFRRHLDVVELVDLTGAHGVVVEGAHGPAERTAALAELGVEALLALGIELLVVWTRVASAVGRVFFSTVLVGGAIGDDTGGLLVVPPRECGWEVGLLVDLVIVLDDGVVGNADLIGAALGGGRAA